VTLDLSRITAADIEALDPIERAALWKKVRNPLWSVPRMAKVKDFRSRESLADFERIDPNLRGEVAEYCRDLTPEEEEAGQETRWPVVVKGRQTARSTNFELAGMVMAMYRPGWDHVCIADTDPRAKYLHKRCHYSYQRWPEAMRTATYSAKEMNQLTFDGRWGGVCRTLSAASAFAGIGQSIDSFHASEVGYWTAQDPAELWADLYPAMAARPNAKVVFECNPTQKGSWWHQFYLNAKRADGRYKAFFTPFFLARMCERPWALADRPDLDEQRLLDRYGHAGLRLEHLAFRRNAMKNVDKIRRAPEQFGMYYPFDDVTCWMGSVRTVFPGGVLDHHQQAVLVPWEPTHNPVEFEAPTADGLYVIGVDPSGFAARDHAAAHVWRANRGEERQCATFADHVAPDDNARMLFALGMRYNTALIVVEANGVGQGVIAVLRQMGYPNLYWRDHQNPGWNNNPSTVEEHTGYLVDFLGQPTFAIRDQDTVEQLLTYGHDKKVEPGDRQEQVGGASRRGGNLHGRIKRERHHWDKVSALLSVIVGLRSRLWPGGEVRFVDPRATAADVFRPTMNELVTLERRQEARRRSPHASRTSIVLRSIRANRRQ